MSTEKSTQGSPDLRQGQNAGSVEGQSPCGTRDQGRLQNGPENVVKMCLEL